MAVGRGTRRRQVRENVHLSNISGAGPLFPSLYFRGEEKMLRLRGAVRDKGFGRIWSGNGILFSPSPVFFF